MKPNKLEMKARKNIKRWTEPLTYVVLVAAFGFITTVVTHASSDGDTAVQDKDMVSVSLENDLEAMFGMVKENIEVSL